MTRNTRYMAFAIAAAALVAAALYTCPEASAAEPRVKYLRGRISVTAEESPFGEVMDKIARSAGFEVLISPDIAQKTLSTQFSDIELERGIQRLMGLISHRNFFIFYGRQDNIKKIEVYGEGGSLGTITGPGQPTGSAPAVPVRNSSQMPMVMDPAPSAPGTPITPASPSTPRRSANNMGELPYIPPAAVPEYIPPRRGIGQIRK